MRLLRKTKKAGSLCLSSLGGADTDTQTHAPDNMRWEWNPKNQTTSTENITRPSKTSANDSKCISTLQVQKGATLHKKMHRNSNDGTGEPRTSIKLMCAHASTCCRMLIHICKERMHTFVCVSARNPVLIIWSYIRYGSIYIHMYTYACVCVCVIYVVCRMCIYICVCVHLFIYLSIYLFNFIYIYIYICVCGKESMHSRSYKYLSPVQCMEEIYPCNSRSTPIFRTIQIPYVAYVLNVVKKKRVVCEAN